MKSYKFFIPILFLIHVLNSSLMAQTKDNPKQVKTENVSYQLGETKFEGFVAYDASITGKRPVILVVPEWWGLNDYTRMRAKKLAELGYLAFAVDMYGNGKIAENPEDAQKLASPFYKDPSLSKARLDAALQKVKFFPMANLAKIAAIGYCFGGSVVLNSAKQGADLKGVVSFHGGLAGVPADKKLLHATILVCHGGNDKFVPQHDIDNFKHQLDSIGANYTFKTYPGATHAFTNPDATKVGKKFNMPIEYNEAADKASWNDMIVFLNTLFK